MKLWILGLWHQTKIDESGWGGCYPSKRVGWEVRVFGGVMWLEIQIIPKSSRERKIRKSTKKSSETKLHMSVSWFAAPRKVVWQWKVTLEIEIAVLRLITAELQNRYNTENENLEVLKCCGVGICNGAPGAKFHI